MKQMRVNSVLTNFNYYNKNISTYTNIYFQITFSSISTTWKRTTTASPYVLTNKQLKNIVKL